MQRIYRSPPDEGAGGGSGGGNTGTPPAQGGNNSAGNPGGVDNNAGQDPLDLGNLWVEPEETKASGTPPAESTTSETQANPVAQFDEAIKTLDFGVAMKPETMQELADGNIDGFNQQINGLLRESFRANLTVVGHMFKQLKAEMAQQFQNDVGTTLNNREQQQYLVQKIPQAANPVLAPVISQVFTQAMKKHGSKEKAVEVTQAYIRNLAREAGGAVFPEDGGDLNPNFAGGSRNANHTDWSDYFGLK